MAYCSECGVKLDATAKFCNGCGVDLSEALPETTFETRSLKLSAIDWRNIDWKPIVGSGATILLLVVALDIGSTLFQRDGDLNQLSDDSTAIDANDDTAPDFTNYRDAFLSENIEQQVTSAANVRNYPTSRHTRKLSSLNVGTTVSGRWVLGFDPSTKWLKLADGGYVWEGNLKGQSNQSKALDVEFPGFLQGKWSSKDSCSGNSLDVSVTIGRNEIFLPRNTWKLYRVSMDDNGERLYHMRIEQHGETVDTVLKFSFSANGRFFKMVHVDNPAIDDRWFFDADLNCEQLF